MNEYGAWALIAPSKSPMSAKTPGKKALRESVRMEWSAPVCMWVLRNCEAEVVK
jgi:hypothetical protein